jgi:hypothetical protein
MCEVISRFGFSVRDKSLTHFSRPGCLRKVYFVQARDMEAAHVHKRNKKPPYRKIVLKLPDLDHAKSAVLNDLSSSHSRKNCKFTMEQFITRYCSEPRLALNRTVVLRFHLYLESLGLAAGTVKQRLAAVRRLAYEALGHRWIYAKVCWLFEIRRQSGHRMHDGPIGNAIIFKLPYVGYTDATEDEVGNLPTDLLCCRQDFFNPCPGSTLKHEVLQVKFRANEICGCKQTTCRLLNAFICQAGVIKVLLDHSLGMGNVEQVKKADNNGTMLVEKIFLQQVIHDRIRK